MTDAPFAHLLVPIVNLDDAKRTCEQLDRTIDSPIEIITVVFVIEHREGYIDPAPPGALKEEAERVFSYVEGYFGEGPMIQRELRSGHDAVSEIIAAADEYDVSAIGFSPRPKTRLQRLLTENSSYRLITESHYPVLVFSADQMEKQ